MFPEPPRPVLTRSQHFARVRPSRGSFHPYPGRTRIQCEECVWVLHEAQGAGALPRSARVSWLEKFEGERPLKVMLCSGHADMWKTATGR